MGFISALTYYLLLITARCRRRANISTPTDLLTVSTAENSCLASNHRRGLFIFFMEASSFSPSRSVYMAPSSPIPSLFHTLSLP